MEWINACVGKSYFIGLSHDHMSLDSSATVVQPGAIQFALRCHNGKLRCHENGSWKGSFSGPYKAGDRLAIKVKGDTVTYYQNGSLIYTSKQLPNFPLVVDCSFGDAGVRVEKPRFVAPRRARSRTSSSLKRPPAPSPLRRCRRRRRRARGPPRRFSSMSPTQ